jgi:hypothetical protein
MAANDGRNSVGEDDTVVVARVRSTVARGRIERCVVCTAMVCSGGGGAEGVVARGDAVTTY